MNQKSFVQILLVCGGGVFFSALIFANFDGNDLEHFDIGIRMTLRLVGAAVAFAGLFLTVRNSISGPGPSVLGRSACIFLAGCTILYSAYGYAFSLAIILAALIIAPALPRATKASDKDAGPEPASES